MDLVPGKLSLKTGEEFHGKISSYQDPICYGEVVFNTGMTGYVETLTDPSYSGQLLVFTYPLIGNYGVSDPSTWESSKIYASGVVMSELAMHYSNHNAVKSLADWLKEQNIPFITGVDTRAITTRVRTEGVISGAICQSSEQPKAFEDFDNIHWVAKASIDEPRTYGKGDKTIIAVDCGMKENISRCLEKLPINIKRVPHDYDYSEEDFDGVFLSNGPGNPTHCKKTIAILKKAMKKEKPIFGICLGTQLMALAVGAKTYKLTFGHRSQNQPCMYLDTKKCYLTSQNHSYAVDAKSLPKDWQVTFTNLNDDSVEGIAHKSLPFFAVQFHPEAQPGPHDTQWLFQYFYDKL